MMIHEQPSPYIVPPCHKEVEILYQDNDIVLVNKPDGLLSVPGRHPLNNDSVYSRLLTLFADMTDTDVRVCHRLDLDTSGVMVFALNRPALVHINRQFEQRQTRKLYTALVDGIIADNIGEINLPLIADWPNRPLQKVCYETGKVAQTYFEVIKRDTKKNNSRILLKPITGRSHQLRIHLKEIGHPILGCDMYAHREAYEKADRLMLHATELVLTHPTTQKTIQQRCEATF